MLRESVVRSSFVLIPPVLLASLISCSESEPNTSASDNSSDVEGEECSGHGHLHDDHCDCDEGYVTDPEDDEACVKDSEGGSPPDDGMGGMGGTTSKSEPCDLQGNIGADELPGHGSVAFVVVDGDYQFVKKPGMEDTSISFIDSKCESAYGWSRDKPFDDDDAVESSWKLELSTMEFVDLEIEGTTWAVLRDGLDSGLIVGKAGVDSGTPDDPDDDESRAFIHDPATGETTLIKREGFGDIGFTTLNGEVIAGFNDFGTQGYVYQGDEFHDLNHPDAFRLFPFQVNASGMIVGFWGESEDTWFENSANPAFVAEPTKDGYDVKRYELSGKTGTGLTGLNDAGQVAGLTYASSSSLPVVFSAESVDDDPNFYPLSGDLEPFPTGISEEGLIHGQVFILEEPRECGGHGTAESDTCTCDDGYELDSYDPMNCLPPDAECSGHGHLHGDECHCDDGFKKSAADATKCVPS